MDFGVSKDIYGYRIRKTPTCGFALNVAAVAGHCPFYRFPLSITISGRFSDMTIFLFQFLIGLMLFAKLLLLCIAGVCVCVNAWMRYQSRDFFYHYLMPNKISDKNMVFLWCHRNWQPVLCHAMVYGFVAVVTMISIDASENWVKNGLMGDSQHFMLNRRRQSARQYRSSTRFRKWMSWLAAETLVWAWHASENQKIFCRSLTEWRNHEDLWIVFIHAITTCKTDRLLIAV